MRITILVLVIVLFGLQYKLWMGDGSVSQWNHLQKRLDQQEQENQKLAAKNRAMEAEIYELKSGEQALEEQARYELGMIKNGEEYYQIVE